jgi:hypothetical protein
VNTTAEIIRAVAALAWPVVLGIFLWRFKRELAGLLGRIEEARVAGSHFKFRRDLDRLNKSAQEAVDSVRGTESTTVVEPEVPAAVVVALETPNPRAGLIMLAAELERRVRTLAAQMGMLYANPNVWRGRPVTSNTLRLFDLPSAVLTAVDEFRQVRNRIVHGGHASDDEVLRAMDSAVMILDALDHVQREINTVYAADVPLYADADGRTELEGVRAVILRTVDSSDPTKETFRVFPTTRTHFRTGEPVAWEWGSDRSWGESWYRDPDSGEIKYAFTSSAEFIGTPLADV